MIKINKDELNRAYILWLVRNRNVESDKAQQPYLSAQIFGFEPGTDDSEGSHSCLQTARTDLLLSVKTLAERLGINRGAYANFEINEKRGTISLNTLARAAAAMDCELVYSVRSKSRKTFSNIVWEEILQKALSYPLLKHCNPHRRTSAVANVVAKLIKDPRIRRQLGWGQRKVTQKLG